VIEMGRKHKKGFDRNQKARANMEDLKIAKERIEKNKELYEGNQKMIPDFERRMDTIKRAYELEQEGDRIKLSGLTVIDPKFEFERTKEWAEWNKKSIELEMERREETFKTTTEQVEEKLKELKEQNERIEKENSELTEALEQHKQGKTDYHG
jgi:hypothetical protein